jgi:hypothetical protein
MTAHELAEIAVNSRKLRDEGKIEEARALLNKIPVTPACARAYKMVYGGKALLESGMNLSEVRAAYGDAWFK